MRKQSKQKSVQKVMYFVEHQIKGCGTWIPFEILNGFLNQEDAVKLCTEKMNSCDLLKDRYIAFGALVTISAK